MCFVYELCADAKKNIGIEIFICLTQFSDSIYIYTHINKIKFYINTVY
jgi:hypothetical protein